MFGSQNAYGGYSNSYGNAQPPPTNAYYNNNNNSSSNNTNNNNSDSFYKSSNHSSQSRVNSSYQDSKYPPPSNNSPPSSQHGYNDSKQNLDSNDGIETGLSALSIDTRPSNTNSNSNNNEEFPSLSGAGSFTTRVPKPSSWASVASQPVKSQPKLLKTKMAVAQGLLTGANSKHLPPTVTMVAINSWDTKNGSKVPPSAVPPQQQPANLGNPVASSSPPLSNTSGDAKPLNDDGDASSEDERSSWNTEMQKHQKYEREREIQAQRNDQVQETKQQQPKSIPPPQQNHLRDNAMTNGNYSKPAANTVYKLRPYDPSTMPPINHQQHQQSQYHQHHRERDADHHYREDNYRENYYVGKQNYNPRAKDHDNHYHSQQQQPQQYHSNHHPQQQQRQRYNNNSSPPPYDRSQNSYVTNRQQDLSRERDRMANCSASPGSVKSSEASNDTSNTHPILEKLICENNYNPEKFDLQLNGARFFIIKSFSEDDVHRSIKYSIWCSTEHGNKRLDTAFRDQEGQGPIYLFFSVNRSGHFCGVAEMKSEVDYRASSGVWSQDKWKGQFQVRWIYVKDVPNDVLRHITLENNENKPVTNSRDTQEVPAKQGKEVVGIIHHYKHSTSIFDDFPHYEQKQEKERPPEIGGGPNTQQSQRVDGPNNRDDRRRASSPPPLFGPGSGYDRRDRQPPQQRGGGGEGYGPGNGNTSRDHYNNRSNNGHGQQNPNYHYQNRNRGYGDNYQRNNDHYRNNDYNRNNAMAGEGGYESRRMDNYNQNRGNYNQNRDRNNYESYGSQPGGQQQQQHQPREYNRSDRGEHYQNRSGEGYERRQSRNDHFRRNDQSHLERESWRN